LSDFSSSFANILRDLIGVAVLYGIVYMLLTAALEFWVSGVCLTEELANFPNVSGFDFEVSETDCWHSPDITVFVSNAGQRKKTPLFTYAADAHPVPAITSIDEHTVQMSIRKVRVIYCRRNKWEDLTIKYDIGFIEYPDNRGPPDEC